ncbi:MAG: glycosyltransferase [Deltaproteobacteria bacterium]|nr:glycosyltransferase [Deltaproteobacteria bacterium]
MYNKIIILIPSLEPDEKLISLIKKLLEESTFKIVVVDDGSPDKTIFNKLDDEKMCHILTHDVNLGKGRALKTGFNYILTTYPDCSGIITADSDGQHTPEGIKDVASAFIKNPNDLILGSRNFKGRNIPLRSRFGNLLTIKVFSFFSGLNLQDTQTGLRGIPRKFMKSLLSVAGERFEFEMQMLMECKPNNIAVKEVFIDTVYIEENKSSHFNPVVDSAKIYFIFLKYSFSSIFASFIDFIVFYMTTALGGSLVWSMFIARVIASVTNFTVNKTAVFKSDNKIHFEVIKYYALVVLSGVTSFYIIKFLSEYFLSISTITSKIIAETLLFFINYYVQNRFVFKSKNVEKNTLKKTI